MPTFRLILSIYLYEAHNSLNLDDRTARWVYCSRTFVLIQNNPLNHGKHPVMGASNERDSLTR